MALCNMRRQAIAALGAAALLAFGCASQGAPKRLPAAFTRAVDLSQVVRQDVPYLPGEPPTRIDRAADGSVRQIHMGAHTGTMLRVASAPDAALHTVDQLSPRELALPAVVIDLRDIAQDLPGYRVSAADLLGWEREHGRIPRGALVLLVTGWDMRWGDPTAYLSLDGAGRSQAPALHAEATDLLFGERGAAGLGLDAPGVTYAPADGYRLLLENLTGMEQLPPTGATVVIGALKLQASQSSPARVIALVP
jgi:kynurenine formamidase